MHTKIKKRVGHVVSELLLVQMVSQHVALSSLYEDEGVFARRAIHKGKVVLVVDDAKADKMNDGGFQCGDLPLGPLCTSNNVEQFIFNYNQHAKERNNTRFKHPYFYATRDIAPGKEITKQYFPAFWMTMAIIDLYKQKLGQLLRAQPQLLSAVHQLPFRDLFHIPPHVPLLQTWLTLHAHDPLTQSYARQIHLICPSFVDSSVFGIILRQFTI